MRGAQMMPTAVALLLAASRGGAQVTDTITFGTWIADDYRCGMYSVAPPPVTPAPRAPGPVDTVMLVRHGPRDTMDTTVVLSVASHDWSRESYDGGTAVGINDMWHRGSHFRACAGVSVHLGQATVALRGVRGTVRLYGNLTALEFAARRTLHSSDTSPSSSSTPPAGPPRR